MSHQDDFCSLLRHALKHLYDPNVLQDSRLIRMLGLSQQPNPTSALRQTITRAIRALEPKATVPDQSPLWRNYEILLYRYVQQCSQLEVANQLGISSRHLRRQELAAIKVLLRQLQRTLPEPRQTGGSSRPPSADGQPGGDSPVDAELAWLEASPADEPVDLAQVLSSVLQLIRPMADSHRVTVEVAPYPELPPLAAHPVALRQILLSLLGVAVRQATGTRIVVEVGVSDGEVDVTLRTRPASSAPLQEADAAESVEMVQRLLAACGGRLALSPAHENGTALAVLTLPTVRQLPVLVIDDNADTLDLLRRYASGTRYRVYGARHVEEALERAAEVAPDIVVLDVMMPDLNGWDLLGRLKHHPLTESTPVVICTILPEEELALSLGADGFVHKPLSRSEFLEALDRQADRAGRESR
jgi:CheY-like chemotaxis protein